MLWSRGLLFAAATFDACTQKAHTRSRFEKLFKGRHRLHFFDVDNPVCRHVRHPCHHKSKREEIRRFTRSLQKNENK